MIIDYDSFNVEHYVEEVDYPIEYSPRSTNGNKDGFQTHRTSDAPVKSATGN